MMSRPTDYYTELCDITLDKVPLPQKGSGCCLVSRPSHVCQCMQENLGRPGLSGGVIGCSLSRISAHSPTQ